MNLRFSPDQKKVLDSLLDWYKSKPTTITFGGYAGTGKTTLIGHLRNLLGKEKKKLKVAFLTYTGKASLVLRAKLRATDALTKRDFVGTIHSLIYKPIENDKHEIVGWELRDLDEVDYDIIIIDEASMVNQNIWNDLLTFDIPIIAVGDHGQLPPIEGKFNLMQSPQLMLEKIHRQAEDNPIIKLSTLARERGYIPPGDYSEGVKKYIQGDLDARERLMTYLDNYSNETLILCGYNNTRIRLNNYIRNAKGYETPEPKSGDKLICLRNNHEEQIFNGMLGTLMYIEDQDEDAYFAEIELEDGRLFEGAISKPQFNSPTPLNFTRDRKRTLKTDLFDFGYALTVHKAQGSQSKRVILFEERFKQMDDEMWRRWLYTAVTRAEEELYIIGS